MEKSAKSIKDTFEQWAEQIKQAIDESKGVSVDDKLNDIYNFLIRDYVRGTVDYEAENAKREAYDSAVANLEDSKAAYEAQNAKELADAINNLNSQEEATLNALKNQAISDLGLKNFSFLQNGFGSENYLSSNWGKTAMARYSSPTEFAKKYNEYLEAVKNIQSQFEKSRSDTEKQFDYELKAYNAQYLEQLKELENILSDVPTYQEQSAPTVSSDIRNGYLTTLSDLNTGNNAYLDKLVTTTEQDSVSNSINTLISSNQSVMDQLLTKTNEMMSHTYSVQNTYSSDILNTVQSINTKFDTNISTLASKTNGQQTLSLTIPKGYNTNQLTYLFNQLKQLGISITYR